MEFAQHTRVSARGTSVTSIAVAVSLAMAASAAPAAEDETLAEVQITGSRIQQTSGFETPTPVTTVSTEELDKLEPGQIIDSLADLPVFFNTQRPQTTGFPSSAGSNLDLRGAGPTRTLVLLDGRRIPSGNRFGTANVGALPEGVIRSVETVTGGASAAYGSDAVAGVVNFILDKDFAGLKAHVQSGQTSRNDGENHEIGASFGMSLGARGHLLLSADYFSQNPIIGRDSQERRPWFLQRALVTGPAGGPTLISRNYVTQTNVSRGGIINQPGSALDKLEFVSNNGVTTARPLNFSGVGAINGGCNCMALPARDPTWGMDADNAVLNENARNSQFAYLSWDFTDNFTAYVQASRGFATVNGPWFTPPVLVPPVWSATIFSGNPYLPAGVQQILTNESRPSFSLGITGDNQWYQPNALGTYTIEQRDDARTYTTGFDWRLADSGYFEGWKLRAYAQYGESHQQQRFRNGMRMDRLPLALDVVTNPANGQPACRAAVVNPALFGNCVPVNLFGGVQNISSAAAAYLVDPLKVIDSKYQQTFAEAVVDGRVADGWAGPIMAAFGASYRKDEIYQYVPDLTDEFVYLNGASTGFRGLIPENLPNGIPGVRAGSVPPGFLGASNLASVLFTGSYQTPTTALQGSFDVREIFTELNVPLLKDKPAVRALDASFAYRYADYTGSGGISSWKYGLSWQVVDAVRFRGTVSRDVRAATIRERFDSTAGGAQVLDPMFNRASISTASRSGGNPNADPEKADTKTLGVVFQPSGVLDGVSLSADWYKIDISDALLQLTSQTIVDNCFNGATNLCQYVIRDPVSQQITRVDSLFINISNQVLEGIDFEAQYRHRLAEGSLTWRFLGTRVLENSQQQPGIPRDFLDREQPKWRLLANVTYAQGPFSATLSERFLSGRLLNRLYVEGRDVDENDVPSWAVTDLNVTYRIPLSRGEWRVFGTVSNVLDRGPPQTPGALNFTGGTAGPNAAFYDTIGRRWVLGVNLKL